MLDSMYIFLFLLSFGMLITLVVMFRNRVSEYYSLLFVSVGIINFGYMQMAQASSLQMAVQANQIIYLGASFAPFLLIMCLADLCKTQIKKCVQVVYVIYSCAILFFTFTISQYPWYYKSIQLIQENGMSRLEKVYGPVHVIYPIYLLLSVLIGIVLVVYAMRHKKDVSHTTCVMLLACLLISIATYVLERIFNLKIAITPVAYMISQFGVLVLLRRISYYDLTAITVNNMVASKEYGFAVWDSKGRYLGADVAAKTWFPELEELKIDVVAKKEDTPFLEQMGRWVRREDVREHAYIEQNSRIIEATHSIVKEKKRRSIHCVYLRDETKQQEYTKLIEKYNNNLEQTINEKSEMIHQIRNDILISMASIVENRDSNTGGHIARTSDVVKIFVKHLQDRGTVKGMTEKIAKSIVKSAPLHDFGKIAIPDVVLNKPGKFTEAEYTEMKKHSEKGAVIVEQILQNVDDRVFKKVAVNVAHYHHEKWDGTGYPDGLKGQEIPFEARVMALADVFDALVSKRVYKESYSYDKAFYIIEEACGTHFDPVLCKEFIRCRRKFEDLYNSYGDD